VAFVAMPLSRVRLPGTTESPEVTSPR